MKTILLLFLAGISIGWIAGLSSSPVIGAVLSTLMALLVSAIALLSKIRDGTDGDPDAIDAAAFANAKPNVAWVSVLIIGIALGATAGLTARLQDWFSPNFESYSNDVKSEIELWTALGVDRKSAVTQIFESSVGEFSRSNGGGNENGGLQSSNVTSFCSELNKLDKTSEIYLKNVQNQILASNILGLKAIRDGLNLEQIDLATRELCEDSN